MIYFSDNGPNAARWNGGMKGIKGSTDEGGVRSVCFIRWPGGGIRAGTIVREIAGAIDLLPTLIGVGGHQARRRRSRSMGAIFRRCCSASAWIGRTGFFSRTRTATSARARSVIASTRAGALFDMLERSGPDEEHCAGTSPTSLRA